LKLNCGEPLSNVGFNFTLRRYTKYAADAAVRAAIAAAQGGGVIRMISYFLLYEYFTNRISILQ